MSYPTHLIKVNNTFYYKVKVPVDIQNHFPCKFIKKSLKTPDLREAKTLLVALEYWIPLIGVYSGMRLNEICQLYVSDIICFDGLWSFNINAEKDKRLMNVNYFYRSTTTIIPVLNC